MEVNILGENVKTTYDVVCSNCDFTGTVTVTMPKIDQLNTGNISFNGLKCQSCKTGDIYGKSGKYKRDENGHMVRIGDYTE